MRAAAVATADIAWRDGDLLPGGLRLLRCLALGGTSEVWEASGPNGPVAVKALRPELVERPGFAEVLAREARKGRMARHPALVAVLDHGCAMGRPFIVFELLRGTTLAESGLEQLARRHVARLLAGPAAALARLHAAGLVHGDVKPGNLFLEAHGSVRLLDLGAARMAADSALDATGWTPPHGLPAATPRWAAPERLRGEPPDPRDDVHSLARVATALLAGPPSRIVRAALGPRAGRPVSPVALVRSLRSWGPPWPV
jgi:serine/threonine protein kinase